MPELLFKKNMGPKVRTEIGPKKGIEAKLVCSVVWNRFLLAKMKKVVVPLPHGLHLEWEF